MNQTIEIPQDQSKLNIKNVRLVRVNDKGTKKTIYYDISTGLKLKDFVHPENTFIQEGNYKSIKKG